MITYTPIKTILCLILVVTGLKGEIVTDRLVQSATQNVANDELLDRLYGGLSNAETNMAYLESQGITDPFIRTLVEGSGSSAYGPLQMTGGKGSMMANVLGDTGLQKKLKLTEGEVDYIRKFREQGQLFLDYGGIDMQPGFEQYDYGMSGTLSSKKDKKLYEDVSRKILDYQFNVQAKGDPMVFLKDWKMGSGKSMDEFNQWAQSEEAQGYINRFLDIYGT